MILDDKTWEAIEPLVKPDYKGVGRKTKDNRIIIDTILYALANDMSWCSIPGTEDGVSGVTCWRRLVDWKHDGTWEKVETILKQSVKVDCNWHRVYVERGKPRRRRMERPSWMIN